MPDLEVPLTFAGFHKRLLELLRHKLRNGEITERALASDIQISQPHMHNVMGGHRKLTADIGDDLLIHFDLTLLDLCEDGEIFHHLMSRGHKGRRDVMVPLLRGRLGPGWTFPDVESIQDWIPVRCGEDAPLRTPALVELEEDPSLPPLFQGGGRMALLECAPEARIRIEREGWYAVRTIGGEAIRQLRKETGGLLVLGQMNLFDEGGPRWPPIGFGQQLRFVRARVRWVGEDPRRRARLDQAGWLRSPADSR